MGSSRSNKLYCSIRCLYVEGTPEEQVRQRLISHMLGPLGYPRGLLAVEKNLFASGEDRRVDLVCFTPSKESLKPLLLVECKAGLLTKEAENQLFGYNTKIGAPFLCLVNSAEIKMFWQELGERKVLGFLPSYMQLIEKLC